MLSVFKASPVYRTYFRIARTIQRNPQKTKMFFFKCHKQKLPRQTTTKPVFLDICVEQSRSQSFLSSFSKGQGGWADLHGTWNPYCMVSSKVSRVAADLCVTGRLDETTPLKCSVVAVKHPRVFTATFLVTPRPLFPGTFLACLCSS